MNGNRGRLEKKKNELKRKRGKKNAITLEFPLDARDSAVCISHKLPIETRGEEKKNSVHPKTKNTCRTDYEERKIIVEETKQKFKIFFFFKADPFKSILIILSLGHATYLAALKASS